MKCPFCDGTGEFARTYGEPQTCRLCGGSGHITVTNEERLRGSSDKELPAILKEMYVTIHARIKNDVGGINKFEKGTDYFSEWLESVDNDDKY